MLPCPSPRARPRCTSSTPFHACSAHVSFSTPFMALSAFLNLLQLPRIGFAMSVHTSFAAYCTTDLSKPHVVQRRRQSPELLRTCCSQHFLLPIPLESPPRPGPPAGPSRPPTSPTGPTGPPRPPGPPPGQPGQTGPIGQPEGWGAQKFRYCSFPRRQFRSVCSLWVFFVEL